MNALKKGDEVIFVAPSSFVNVPTVLPYTAPGIMNKNVISVTISFTNGDAGLPKI